jgi:hypothetical protein
MPSVLDLEHSVIGTRVVSLDIEAALAGQGLPRDARPGGSVMAAARQAVEAAPGLVDSRFVCTCASIAHRRATGVDLTTGVIEGEAIACALDGAELVVAVVCTIGPLLERRVSALLDSDPLLALAFDGLGSVACERLAGTLCGEIEEQAAERGMGVTGPLAPGMIGWPLLEAQRQVFALADPAPIGVVLTPVGQMLPRKSLSFVVGAGAGVQARTTCVACGARDRCKFRPNHA